MTKTLRIPRDVVTFREAGDDFSYHLAIKANQRLTAATAARLAQLVGYAWRQHIRGENLGDYQRVGHDKIVFWNADTTKTVRDDLDDAWFDFLEGLDEIVQYGSPMRTTNRMGPGTAGTRLIEGLGAGFAVEVYAA